VYSVEQVVILGGYLSAQPEAVAVVQVSDLVVLAGWATDQQHPLIPEVEVVVVGKLGRLETVVLAALDMQ
jgi:hypothetical protein